MSSDWNAISKAWNEAGRRHALDVQERLGRFHRGELEDPELPADPRGRTLASQVLDAVLALNERGAWREARRRFDPAHQPLVPVLAKQALPFVVALGEDEALFRRGTIFQPGHLWHVAGETFTPLEKLLAAAISPDRKMLALADVDGVRVHEGWQGPLVASLPWPSTDDLTPSWVPGDRRGLYTVESPVGSLASLCVANSGMRIAIASRSGVLVGDSRAGRVSWSLVLPRQDRNSQRLIEQLDSGEACGFEGDMAHVAMSGDGVFLACGHQDDGHHVFSVDPSGRASEWAKIDRASEYPHSACFSTDGTQVAFNSCHLYNGATIAADPRAIQGESIGLYERDPRLREINSYLRVYASTWIPEGILPGAKAAFALAGASALTFVTPGGEVLRELLFASTAAGIDYCPSSETLVLGSYSGMLHFLKPAEDDQFGMGWQPPREIKRWCFLEKRTPIQW